MCKRMYQHAIPMNRINQHIMINHQFSSPAQFRLATHVRILLKKIHCLQNPVDDTHSSLRVIARDIAMYILKLTQRAVG